MSLPIRGGGTAEVNVSADPNPNFKSRETSLTFHPTGGIAPLTVQAIQQGIVLFPVISFSTDNNHYGETNFVSFTDTYDLSGDHPIQKMSISWGFLPKNVNALLQVLVRKDYLDVPASEFLINEKILGLTETFEEKISVNSEYNLYLYSGSNLNAIQGGKASNMLIMISLGNQIAMYEWDIKAV